MESTNMINLWKRVTIYCMNHDKPRLMQIISNTEKIRSPFYGCTQYFPDTKESDAMPCPNRLNMDDYQNIVLKFSDIVSSEGITNDWTNYEFEYRGGRQRTKVRCLKYSDDEIRLGVFNRTVLGR